MSKPKLDLLASLQLQEVVGAVGVRTSKVQRNPVDADIRLFADGSCYPSEALVKEFHLEYQPKNSSEEENGFDIFETSQWGMWPKDTESHFVMISKVSKHSKKVDLFSKTTYNPETGKSRNSVLDQGAATFGKRLIPMLERVYGSALFEQGNAFVDLVIERETPVPGTSNGIYNLPKLIVKGEKANTYSTERRENITIYPLTIKEESMLVVDKEQDPAISEIASLGESSGGQFSDEPLLGTTEPTNDVQRAEDALAQANSILSEDDVVSN